VGHHLVLNCYDLGLALDRPQMPHRISPHVLRLRPIIHVPIRPPNDLRLDRHLDPAKHEARRPAHAILHRLNRDEFLLLGALDQEGVV
jgi:hypothetical protein